MRTCPVPGVDPVPCATDSGGAPTTTESTPPIAPSAPTGLDAAAYHGSEVVVSWDAPADLGKRVVAGSVAANVISYYEYQLKPAGGSFGVLRQTGSADPRTQFLHEEGQAIRVRAVADGNLRSDWSAEFVIPSRDAVATLVLDRTVLNRMGSGNSAVLRARLDRAVAAGATFTVTADPAGEVTFPDGNILTVAAGGSESGGIAVTAKPSGAAALTEVTLSAAVTSAANVADPGAVTLSLRAVAPGRPVLTAARSADARSAALSWTAPANGGNTLLGYRWQRDAVGGSFSPAQDEDTTALGTETATAGGLDRDTAYAFRVRASNPQGNGPWSEVLVVAGRPGAPGGFAAAANAYGIGLSWTAPASTGGKPLTGYRVEWREDSDNDWATDGPDGSRGVAPGAASVTLTADDGLALGDAYNFRIRAENEDSNGVFTPGDGSVEAVMPAQTDTPPGVTVTAADPLTIEEGATGTYTVVLDVRPTGNVTIRAVPGDGSGVTVNPATLTFTRSNWNRAKTVTVTAAQDGDADGETGAIAHTIVTASTAAEYDAVEVASVAVAVTDDDMPGIAPSPGAVTVHEGGTAAYTVALTAQPTGDVVIDIASGDATAATVSPAELTFTPDNWNAPQTVTVTGEDDADMDDEQVSVAHTVNAAASADEYDAVMTATVAVTTVDNDVAGVWVSTNRLSIAEGGTATYELRLNTQPAADVTVTVASGDAGAVAVQPATLTFTGGVTGNWATAQTVEVRAVEDADGVSETVTLTHDLTSTDPDYSGGAVAPVTVAVTDNDAGGPGQPPPPDPDPAEPPARVSGVVVTPGVAALAVRWRAAARAARYRVQWKSGSQTYNANRQAETTGTSHTIPGLMAGTDYTVRVTAINSIGDGTPSDDTLDAASAMPDAALRISTRPARLTEDNADGAIVTLRLLGAEWGTDLSTVTVTGLPDGMEAGDAARVSDTEATIALSYAPPGDVDGLEGDARLTVTAAAASHSWTEDIEDHVTVHARSAPAALAATRWLSRFGRIVADHVMAAVGARLAEPAGQGDRLRLAGHRVGAGPSIRPSGATQDEGWRQADGGVVEEHVTPDPIRGDGSGRAADARSAVSLTLSSGASRVSKGERTLTPREALAGSSFRVSAADGEGMADAGWTAWGRVDLSRFDEDEDGLALDGDAMTATVGADIRRGPLLAGVAAAHSSGSGDYRTADGAAAGDLDASLASVHPYVRVEAAGGLSLWGVLGWGAGDMTLDRRDGDREKADLEMTMAGAGARGPLPAPSDGMALALRAEAFASRIEADGGGDALQGAEAGAWRMRLALEASWDETEAGLRPSAELGLRHDGGDGATGTGAELGGGVAWTGPDGLSASLRARALLDGDGVSEWGGGAMLAYAPGGAGGRGLSLSLAPSMGAPEGGAARLWDAETAALAGRDRDARPRLDAEAGYGFAAMGGRGLLTPHAGLGLSDAGERRYRVGARLTLAPGADLGLAAERNDRQGGPEHALTLNARLRW